jgi:deoxyribose-phosphate aldolase
MQPEKDAVNGSGFEGKLALDQLTGSEAKVCIVIGFPLGATKKVVKGDEAIQAVGSGADEVDMVANLGALKSGK